MTAIVGGVALALTAIAPVSSAVAEDPPAAPADDGGAKAVEESPSGSYIVVMVADPLISTIAPADLDTAVAESQADALADTHDAALAEAGVSEEVKVQDYTNALNGFSAIMSHDEATAVAANPKVAVVLPDELRYAASVGNNGNTGNTGGTDDLGNFVGLTERGEAWKSGITGEDVVIGVIDSGIWPEHPSFADNGSYGPSPIDPLEQIDTQGRPSSSCDFGNTAANPNDAPFTCNNKLLGARQMLHTYRELTGQDPDEFDSARDDDGHGTHTASTAGGNANVQATIFGRSYGTISGIAPRARIIAYKGLGNLGGYTSDLAASIDQAVYDGVDVINYSVGGGAQLISADTIAYLFAADAGVYVATSAGNDGPGPETIGGPADVPWVTTVGANTQRQFFEGTIKLDRGPTITGSSVTPSIQAKTPIVDAVNAFAAGVAPEDSELCLPGSLDPAKVAGKIVLCKRGENGRVDKSLTVINAGGAGMILYNATNVDNYFTDNFWVPTVMVDLSDGLKIKAYLSLRTDPKAQLITGAKSTFKPAPSMAIFSSRGANPTVPDVIKPDITAPGVQILAGNTPFPDPGAQPAGELFQAIAGTSMSSPVVAGVFALVKQAHPDWSAAAAKSALMTTADTNVRDNDRVSQAGPFAMGSGMVDPGKVKEKGSAFNPGLVYDAGFDDYAAFLCGAAPELFSAGTCDGYAGLGYSFDASDLNYPSIAVAELAGSQTVTRTVTSVATGKVTFKAKVTAPAGFAVVVTPDTITLKPGESATYQVTISNVTGTIDEWADGSLTWKGGGYEVRSPIAVKGTLIGTPALVTGEGTEGSTSFDVDFGYTGAYSAAAHGLVAPIVTDGTISQDPNQTPFTADDGAGLDLIPVTITGAAYARWEVVLPGDSDLDLYLIGPNGKVVAQSTNGGTDELIELTLPADGQYVLAVHGWAVDETNGPLPYTLDNWIVSATPGGSLTIDSAPTEAVIATTGTIDISWTGLDPDIKYFGAVSHSDADGLLGLTLVSVQS